MMAHHISGSAYQRLSERLNRFPQGAPATELLFKILKMLFKEREAELVARLPIKPFDAGKAAAIWKMEEKEARQILDQLAKRALLLDFQERGERFYVLQRLRQMRGRLSGGSDGSEIGQ